MIVLVLGRNGQVGKAVTSALAHRHQVIALGRAELNLMTPGAVASAIRDARPDLVVNAAAWTAVDQAEAEPEAAMRVNADAVAELAAATSVPVIHYSSDYVFDGYGDMPFIETDTASPLNVYGVSKLAGEEALRSAGNQHIILRTSWVHAPGHANFVASMLRLASERESLRVVADQIGAPTSATLIADVTSQLVDRYADDRPPPSGIYHLAAAGEVSWHGYAVELLAAALEFGHPLRCRLEAITAIPSAEYPQAARRPLNSRLDCTKLEALLGATLPDWRDGVRETLVASLGVPA